MCTGIYHLLYDLIEILGCVIIPFCCVLFCLRRGVYRVFVGKPERKRPLGRHWRGWEDNIKMVLQEVGCGGINWIALAQDRDRWRALVNALLNLRSP
jgi:hypothetical protein